MRSLLLRIADRLFAPAPDPAQIGWLSQVSYAHRGLHGADRAENSPSAFARAIGAGLGIECDVRKSSDGRAVVFHDAQLERLTGTSGEIGKMDIGQITHVRLSIGGEAIPTLRDVLDQVAGQVPLLLEIKSDSRRSASNLCRAVRRELEGYSTQAAVMSFDPRVGAWFARKAPHITRGLVVSEENGRTFSAAVRRRRNLWQARPHFLAYDIRDLPSAFAARQRARGLPVLTWTVSSPALREQAQLHADAPIAEGAGLPLGLA